LWYLQADHPSHPFTNVVLGWCSFLNSFMPLCKSPLFLFLLFGANSLSFVYSLCLFLKYLLDSHFTLSRLSD
jgi:hypothetical protein